MAIENMRNLAAAKVTKNISPTDNTIEVDDTAIMPPAPFYATIMPQNELPTSRNSEIVKVTKTDTKIELLGDSEQTKYDGINLIDVFTTPSTLWQATLTKTGNGYEIAGGSQSGVHYVEWQIPNAAELAGKTLFLSFDKSGGFNVARVYAPTATAKYDVEIAAMESSGAFTVPDAVENGLLLLFYVNANQTATVQNVMLRDITGTNLASFVNFSGTENGVTSTVSGNTLTTSGTVGSTWQGFNFGGQTNHTIQTIPAGKYIICSDVVLPYSLRINLRENLNITANQDIASIERGRTNGVFEIAKACSAGLFWADVPSGTNVAKTAKITILPYPVEHAYEPYVGGAASPSPDYPQEIKNATGTQNVITGNGNLTLDFNGNLFNKDTDWLPYYFDATTPISHMDSAGNRNIIVFKQAKKDEIISVSASFRRGITQFNVGVTDAEPVIGAQVTDVETTNATTQATYIMPRDGWFVARIQAGLYSGVTDYTQILQDLVNTISITKNVGAYGKNLARLVDYKISQNDWTLESNNGYVRVVSAATNNAFDLAKGLRTGNWLPTTDTSAIGDSYLTTEDEGAYVLSVYSYKYTVTGTQNTYIDVVTNKRGGVGRITINGNNSYGKSSFVLSPGEHVKTIMAWTGASNTAIDASFQIQLERVESPVTKYMDGSYSGVVKAIRATVSEATDGFTITRSEASGVAYAVLPIHTDAYGRAVTLRLNQTGTNQIPKVYYYDSNNNPTTEVSGTTLGNDGGNFVVPNTLPSGATGICVCLYVGSTSGTVGDTATYTHVSLTQNFNNSDTAFEPYMGSLELRKIQDKKDKIVRTTGKNILNIRVGTWNGITATKKTDGSITMYGTSNTSWGFNFGEYQAVLPEIIPAGTYTFSINRPWTLTQYFGLQFWNHDKSQTYSDGRINGNGTSITFELPFDAVFIGYAATGGLTVGTVVNENLKIQLEKGDTATPFEPYGLKTGWAIERNTNKMVLAFDDMNNSADYPGWANITGQRVMEYDFPSNFNADLYDGGNGNFLSNMLPYAASKIAANNAGTDLIWLYRTNFGNKQQSTLKTEYAGKVIDIEYGIQTVPHIEPITNETLLVALDKINDWGGVEHVASVGNHNVPLDFANNGGTYEIVRAQKNTTTKTFNEGDILANSIYDDDFVYNDNGVLKDSAGETIKLNSDNLNSALLLSRLNLVNKTSISADQISYYVNGTAQSDNGVSLATLTVESTDDNKMFKIYGRINLKVASATTVGEWRFNTDLRPAQDMEFKAVGIRVNTTQSYVVSTVDGGVDLKISTAGVVSVTGVRQANEYSQIWLPPELYICEQL